MTFDYVILFLLNGVLGEHLTKSRLVSYVSVKGVKENLWCYTIEEMKSAGHVYYIQHNEKDVP